MATGIACWGLSSKGCCRISEERADRSDRHFRIFSRAALFDVIAVITLVAVGALVLRGRIKLPTEAGIGLLAGAGGIILLDVLGVTFARCYDDRSQEQREQAVAGHEY